MTNKRGKQRAVHQLVPSRSFIHGSVFKRTQNTQILRLLHRRRDGEMWFTVLSANQNVNIKMMCYRRGNCTLSLFYRSFLWMRPRLFPLDSVGDKAFWQDS